MTTDDEMGVEEFDRRFEAGTPVTVSVGLRRESTWHVSVTTQVGVSSAHPHQQMIAGMAAEPVGV